MGTTECGNYRDELVFFVKLSKKNLSNLETIARRVYDLAMYYQIMSPQFTALLAKEFPVLLGDEHSVVVPEFLDHFAELLFAFTISGESLDVFDQNSEYLSRAEYQRRRGSTGAMVSGNSDNDDIIKLRFDLPKAANYLSIYPIPATPLGPSIYDSSF
ncbi:unnamed protein product [Gongylonema pulchrum]|uniref:RGS domain-containing protein n=1 Tax=Gongylonema pulchrum TaxID=637853 RepID=A0A183EGS5_9BILA|nr:unnamed protein product [Gongylonema pulchrum]